MTEEISSGVIIELLLKASNVLDMQRCEAAVNATTVRAKEGDDDGDGFGSGGETGNEEDEGRRCGGSKTGTQRQADGDESARDERGDGCCERREETGVTVVRGERSGGSKMRKVKKKREIGREGRGRERYGTKEREKTMEREREERRRQGLGSPGVEPTARKGARRRSPAAADERRDTCEGRGRTAAAVVSSQHRRRCSSGRPATRRLRGVVRLWTGRRGNNTSDSDEGG
ncbi:hypothetical protein Syun_029493 [Stephania yunnanensis]|uniref:Uncharacterized protein n=1 Tax=Stephania yunnanensis TaxID=152371 RepID=A0AAP0EDU2_9MAGN